MIKPLVAFFISSSLFLTVKSQTFDKTFSLDIGLIGKVRAAELGSNSWAITYNNDYPNNRLNLLLIKESTTGIDHESIPIVHDSFSIISGFIIEEWSDSTEIVGLANATNKSDSASLTLYWKYSDNELEIKPILDEMGFNLSSGFTDYTMNGDNVVGIRIYTVGSNTTVSLHSFNEDFSQTFIGALNLSSTFSIDDYLITNNRLYVTLNSAFIFSGLIDQVISIDDTINTNIYSSSDTSCYDGVRKIVAADANSFYLFGTIFIERDENQILNYDTDLRIAKLNYNHHYVNDFYFGQLDSSLSYTDYGFMSEYLGYESAAISKEGDIFCTANSQGSTSFYPTWIHVFKLDSNLNQKWHYDYTDESGSYFQTFLTKPLSDGGVLIFCYKFDPNLEENNYDLHVLRIKPDGTLYTLSVPMADKPIDYFTLSPNPTNGEIRIIGDVNPIQKITVMDQLGRISQTLSTKNSIIHLSNEKPGIYFVKIQMKDGRVETKKVVKE